MTAFLTPSRLPAGYPVELQRWIHLGTGSRAFVRPVVADDAGILEQALEEADMETIYQRFFRAPVRLDAKALDRLTRLDYQKRMALAAFTEEGEGIGIARYEAIGDGAAEIAVVVQRDWRHAGVGSQLLEILEEAAVARGITRLTALYLPDNEAIAGLLERRGFEVGLPDESVAAAEKHLHAA